MLFYRMFTLTFMPRQRQIIYINKADRKVRTRKCHTDKNKFRNRLQNIKAKQWRFPEMHNTLNRLATWSLCCFNPHIYMRGDKSKRTAVFAETCFNSHTHMRCDYPFDRLDSRSDGFNPHTHMRCDSMPNNVLQTSKFNPSLCESLLLFDFITKKRSINTLIY